MEVLIRRDAPHRRRSPGYARTWNRGASRTGIIRTPERPVTETERPPVNGGTVLISGASSGIGRKLAVQLAAWASVLVLVARRAWRLDELRASLLAQHPQLYVVGDRGRLVRPKAR
jgi:NADPH:quinone reductase-like Zn-dependent oxidoreductase